MLRIGILGTANIAPAAAVEAAHAVDGAAVVAVAARSRRRAAAFAAEHGVPRVEESYEGLVGRSDIDAVYVPLPVSLHREWCERALRAGKHVLCEKPMTTNAADARALVALAQERGLVLAEAFHYRYHPLMVRLLELIAIEEVGPVEEVDAAFVSEVPRDLPVYWDARLGGGATRHNGCYAVHAVRSVVGIEPEVVGATAVYVDGTDAALDGELRFGNGVRGRVRASFIEPGAEIWLRLRGAYGEIRVDNFVLPHKGGEGQLLQRGSIEVATPEGTRRETFPTRPTYHYQLEAFADAIETGRTMATTGSDIVENARVIDSLLTASGGPQ